MESFIACKGSVYVYRPSGGSGGSDSGGGFYALSPELKGSDESPILIHGVNSQDQDVVSPMITLNSKKILYVFGQDFGQISVAGSILLGKAGAAGDGLAKVQEYFNSHRVMNSEEPVSVSLPGTGAYKFFLTGLGLSVPDQQYHVQGFTMVGLIAEPPSN